MASFRVEFAHPNTFTHRAGFATRLDFGAPQSATALPKCEHGIFLAREDERRSGFAWYCATCRPLGFGKPYHYGTLGGDSRKMFFAERYQTPRSERVTANLQERKGNACPKCGSAYRFAVEDSLLVECADCSQHWKPIRRADSLEKDTV